MSTPIRNYILVVEHSPEDLVRTVTKGCQEGFLPVGGVALAVEPAKPDKGIKAARVTYAQAMVRPYRAEDALGQVVARVNGS